MYKVTMLRTKINIKYTHAYTRTNKSWTRVNYKMFIWQYWSDVIEVVEPHAGALIDVWHSLLSDTVTYV